MNLGLCECGSEPAVMLATPDDAEDPWPIGAVCLAELQLRIAGLERPRTVPLARVLAEAGIAADEVEAGRKEA